MSLRNVFIMVLAAVFGCGHHGGPERVVVSGTVTYQGQPVKEGQIRFYPTKGTQAPMSGGDIIDGKYVVEAQGGVPVGTHEIRIAAFRPDPRYREYEKSLRPDASALEKPPKQQYLPEKYNTKTKLEITIPPGSSGNAKDFQLTD